MIGAQFSCCCKIFCHLDTEHTPVILIDSALTLIWSRDPCHGLCGVTRQMGHFRERPMSANYLVSFSGWTNHSISLLESARLIKLIYLNVALLYGMHFQILGHRILCAGFDKTPLICCNVLQAFLKAPVFLHLPGYPVAGAGNNECQSQPSSRQTMPHWDGASADSLQ